MCCEALYHTSAECDTRPVGQAWPTRSQYRGATSSRSCSQCWQWEPPHLATSWPSGCNDAAIDLEEQDHTTTLPVCGHGGGAARSLVSGGERKDWGAALLFQALTCKTGWPPFGLHPRRLVETIQTGSRSAPKGGCCWTPPPVAQDVDALLLAVLPTARRKPFLAVAIWRCASRLTVRRGYLYRPASRWRAVFPPSALPTSGGPRSATGHRP
jgi:hypothetical protein